MIRSILNYHVLLLNQNYEPLSVCSAKRAIVLVYKGKAEIVEQYDHQKVYSVSMAYPLPSIIRLMVFIRIPHTRVVLSRRNIIKRDNHTCQYCGTKKGPMTIDHVIPRKLGGADSWENLVCACLRCNNRKGNRALEETNIRLLRPPRRPNHLTFIQHLVGISDQRWRPYLFLD